MELTLALKTINSMEWLFSRMNRMAVMQHKYIRITALWVVLFSNLLCYADNAKEQHAVIGIQEQAPPGDYVPTKHPDAQWFGRAGLGLFLHWGISSAHPEGKSDLSWSMMKDCPWNADNSGVITPGEYWRLAQIFQPDTYDPDTWLFAAASAGFRYAVLTTKHHDGYALWPSEVGQFNTRVYLEGRDLVLPFVEACRKHNIKVGLYYSPPDWYLRKDYMSFHFGSTNQKRFSGRKHFGLDHEPIELKQAPEGFGERYKAYIRTQMIELLTNYGPIDVIWFDGGPDVISMEEIHRLQPHLVINPRMHGVGDFVTPECQFPETRPSGWWELCSVWGESWGYQKTESYKSAGWALDLLTRTRSWGGNLLLNVGPRPNGELPDVVYDRFREIQDWMNHSGESLFDVESGPWPEKCNVPVTMRKNLWYVHVPPGFDDHVEIRRTERPLDVRLLRTQDKIEYNLNQENLSFKIPQELRTDKVDTVKVQY